MSNGQRKHPLYSVYAEMKSRCFNQTRKDYPQYGGRGISICDRWLEDFWNFVSDMGDRPDGYTLDRVDVDDNYQPNNCRWASRLEQTRNRRGGSTETHCPQGHEFTDTNTYNGVNPSGATYRRCRKCAADRARTRRSQEKVMA